MASYSGTDFNDLAKLLFRSLTTQNPDFNPLTYLDKFETMTTNLNKVNFVYNDIKRFPKVFAKFIKDKKDDSLALQHFDSGKQKVLAGKYWEALEDFTRMISTAETDRVKALAFGNRSECFLKLKMPEKCLQEIERALPDYPKELIDTLLEFKKEAEKLETSERSYYEPVPNHDECVKIESGRVIATRDIEIGEVISVEAPFTSVLTSDRLTHCHECLNLCYNPLPCSTCTVALFCSKVCKEKARPYHKYECPILLTVCYRVICEFATNTSLLLALKVALLTKDCPDTNTLQLRETGENIQVNFLKTNANFSNLDLFHQAILTALMFELLWNYTSFFSGIFSSADSTDKFKEVMFLQLQSTCINAAKIYEYVHKYDFNGTNSFGLGAFSFFSVFAHSCCANVMKTYHGSNLVLRALNTIKTGEECFVNRYGLRYDVSSTFDRKQFLYLLKLPQCECKACEENWTARLGDLPQICGSLNIEVMELGDIVRDVIGSDIKKATEFLTNLIARLEESEESEPNGNVLALKNLLVHCYVIFGNKRVEFDESQNNIVFVP